uniref:Reduced folate transporter n=1 Tax=Panagrolaimus davidi TaxID=227884 RepID=A0A914R2Y9_9BILA
MPQKTASVNLLKNNENGSLLENVEFTKVEKDSEIQLKNDGNGRFKKYILPGLLVFYSIIKEFKVGEPFLYKYHSENLNYTAEILNGEVYPYSAYSYLFAIIPIFLFTDILLYKPIMYIEILGQIFYRFTLSFTSSLFSQQLGQTMGGLVRASDLAFFSYIYGVLEKDQYKRFTSWTRAGTMAGRTGAYLFSQILILTHWSDYHTMNKMAFYIASTALLVCFFLPRIRWKTMVERIHQTKATTSISSSSQPKSYSEYVSYRIRRLHSHFKQIYSNPRIRKWSFYWAMTTCMSLQVSLYYQTLFGIVQIGDDTPLNGFADAGYTFVSVVLILIMNWYSINWDKWGELALVVISTLSAGFLVIFSQAQNAYPMYACYIAYEAFYQLMITISQ